MTETIPIKKQGLAAWLVHRTQSEDHMSKPEPRLALGRCCRPAAIAIPAASMRYAVG